MTNEAKQTLMNVWEQYAPLIPENRRSGFLTDLALLCGVCVESGKSDARAESQNESGKS